MSLEVIGVKGIQDLISLVRGMDSFIEDLKKREDDFKDLLGPYQLGSTCHKISSVIAEFKRDSLIEIADKLIEESLPNISVTGRMIYTVLEDQDKEAFDVSKVLSEIEKLQEEAKTLSMDNLLRTARNLLPNMEDERGYWGSAKNPDKIREGRILKLRAYTWDSSYKDVSYYAYTHFGEVAALDKIAKVLLDDRDPVKVESQVYTILHNAKFDGTLYGRKHHFRSFSVQFYKNDSLKVFFDSEDEAKRIAEALCFLKPNAPGGRPNP